MVLTWHVDYWDRLGWKDPYASPAFSARQRKYKKLRELKVMGTPQFFVDNEVIPWVKGGQESIPGRVDKGATKPATMTIDGAAQLVDGKVTVTVRLARVTADAAVAEGTQITPVLFLRSIETTCTKGENDGRKLIEHFVALRTADSVAAAGALDEAVSFELDAPDDVELENLGVVVLIEDPDTLRTENAAMLSVR